MKHTDTQKTEAERKVVIAVYPSDAQAHWVRCEAKRQSIPMSTVIQLLIQERIDEAK